MDSRIGTVRTRVLLIQGTACAKHSWYEVPGPDHETPNRFRWPEWGLSPEHHKEPLQDF